LAIVKSDGNRGLHGGGGSDSVTTKTLAQDRCASLNEAPAGCERGGLALGGEMA